MIQKIPFRKEENADLLRKITKEKSYFHSPVQRQLPNMEVSSVQAIRHANKVST